MRNALSLLLLLGCGGSSAPLAPVLPPPSVDRQPPPPAAAPATQPVADEPLAPDTPAAEDAARIAELAAKAQAIVDAFQNQFPRLTPDGKKVLFRSNRDGNWQLYAADATKTKAAPVRLTSGPERVGEFAITPDGQAVIYASDQGADEKWRFFRVGLDGKDAVGLTPGEELQRDKPIFPLGTKGDVFYYSARTMGDKATRVYSQSAAPKSTSTPKLLLTEPSSGSLVDVSPDGKTGLMVKLESLTVSTLLLANLEGGAAQQVYPPAGKQAKVHVARFTADGKAILVATDGGGEEALLLKLDPAGTELGRYTETKPATAQLDDVSVSPAGDLVAVRVDAGSHDLVRLVSAKTLKAVKQPAVPLGALALTGFSRDGRRVLGHLATPQMPHEVFAIDVAGGALTYLRSEPRAGLAGLAAIEVTTTKVKSFDDTEVPVNVHLPVKASRPLPVIVSVHGGPAASTKVSWSVTGRFFTDLGYAWVEPNVRGSTGFGRAYEAADNGAKRLDAVKDLEAVARWAGEQPWADKKRLVVMGGSYGGYMVLMALTQKPDLWAAGVDMVGVANWRTFMKTTTGLIRDILSKEFGSLEEEAAFLDSISPANDVDKIRAPLFVYQGANDPRVPRGESDQVVRGLRQRSVPVEYMVAGDEGHSMDRRENKLTFMSRAGRFLEKHLPKPGQ